MSQKTTFFALIFTISSYILLYHPISFCKESHFRYFDKYYNELPGPEEAYFTFGAPIYHTMIRLESHSDKQNTFLYNLVSVTWQTQPTIYHNISLINRYDLTEKEEDGCMFIWNIIRMFNNNFSGTIGYSFTNKPRRKGSDKWDKDRLSLSINFQPKIADIVNLNLTTSFDTNTDWSEGRTLSQKIGSIFNFNDALSGALSYTYAHSFNFNGHLYNQYSLLWNYKLNKKIKISAEYCLVDNTYSYADGTSPESDSIFRLSFLLGF